MDTELYFTFSAAPAEWCEFDRQTYWSLLKNAEAPSRYHRRRAALVIVYYMSWAHRSKVEGPLNRGVIPIKIIRTRFCTDGRS
jgi:hypothetical protein